MQVIKARNVNDAYNSALWTMKMIGIKEQTRNGIALVAPYPIATVYNDPVERMLFDPKRDANPFFHVAEAIWMLAGKNEVGFVKRFASNMQTFSDDGHTLNGAYGARWRDYFEYDQITEVIKLLRKDRHTRRAVLGMWDPANDLTDQTSKDLPCNTHIYFRVNQGYLDMTVCCRSNDIIWGCYGANAVHMSYLQEFIALSCGFKVGTYTQISNNWHVYEHHFNLVDSAATEDEHGYPYDDDNLESVPLIGGPDWSIQFLSECGRFVDQVTNNVEIYGPYQCAYFNWVMVPLVKSWDNYKAGDTPRALQYATTIRDDFISLACQQWLNRRIK